MAVPLPRSLSLSPRLLLLLSVFVFVFTLLLSLQRHGALEVFLHQGAVGRGVGDAAPLVASGDDVLSSSFSASPARLAIGLGLREAAALADGGLRPAGWDAEGGAGGRGGDLDARGHPVARQPRRSAETPAEAKGADGEPGQDAEEEEAAAALASRTTADALDAMPTLAPTTAAPAPAERKATGGAPPGAPPTVDTTCFAPVPVLSIVSNETMQLSRRRKLCTAPHEMGLRSKKCKLTVALSSWEGSGNHFCRYLMEQSSRILTGSKFGDYSQWMLLGARLNKAEAPSGLNALDRQGRTVATKTHLGPDGDALGSGIRPGRAIVVVRDPRGAILANYNRIGSFLPTGYQNLKGRRKRAVKAKAALLSKKRSGSEGSSHHSLVDDWGKFSRERHFDAYLRSEAASWKRDVGAWLADRKWTPKLFVKYEDVKKDTRKWTLKMLAFAGVPEAAVDLARLDCVASRANATARQAKAGAAQDAGGGKRKGMVDASGKYNPYTPQRQRAVWQIAGSVMKKLGYGPFYTP